MGYPKEPGKLKDSEAIVYKRFIDSKTGEIVQLGFQDTGNLTPDGVKIYAMEIFGTIVSGGELKPDGFTDYTVGSGGSLSNLNPSTQALTVILQATLSNIADILVLNVTLTPGETIIIDSVPNVAWITYNTPGSDTLNVTVLTNSTI